MKAAPSGRGGSARAALTAHYKRGSVGSRVCGPGGQNGGSSAMTHFNGKTVPALVAGVIIGFGALSFPNITLAQDRAATDDAQASGDSGPAKRFNCQDGGSILYRFETQRGELVAVVDAFDGFGPHTLASRPYAMAPVRLIWSDGQRTLTWSPGVQIMWMDSSVHRMCGGGHHH